MAVAATYREGLKNWEFDKEAAQIFASGASGIAHEQEASEDQKFAAKLTPTKTNFSVTSGIASSVSPTYYYDLDHFENLSRAVSALTIDPFKHIVFYIFPFVSAYYSNYIQMRENDPAQEAMMPGPYKRQFLKEVRELTELAGIRRKVIPYTTLNYSFSSCGGSFSITNPALFLPIQHLIRPSKSPFGQEKPEDGLDRETWFYTDNQTRFLIARELKPLKANNALVRIAIKVALIAAVFLIYTSPLGWLVGGALMIGSVAFYILSEKVFEGKMDIAGARLLGKQLKDPQKAVQIGIEALEKMRKQNLERRDQSRISRLYITKSGNNALDFNHPFLTTRIERLKEHLKKLNS